MKAKEFIPPSKPRNPVVRQQQTSGAGAHRDKKKEQKQGYEKHKGKNVAEGSQNRVPWDAVVNAIVYDQFDTLMNRYGLTFDDIENIVRQHGFRSSDEVKAEYGQGVEEDDVMEYETHRYTDDEGNEWEVNDEGERTLIRSARGGGGYGSRRFYRPPKPSKPKGYYFYNVPAGKEQDARAAGLRQSKSGKWFDTMTNSAAEKVFGKGRYWEPKN